MKTRALREKCARTRKTSAAARPEDVARGIQVPTAAEILRVQKFDELTLIHC